jgi:ABC-2 type transport system ATP-binding protein
MTSSQPLLSLSNITKRYGEITALDGISLSIQAGEIFGYIGPNGAGKTTTIKICVGLITDFRGQLSIGGHAMPGERGKVHKILGYLPQQVAFQEWRTVDHALRTFGRLSGLTAAELGDRIDEVLHVVGLGDVRSRRVSQLSGGTVQKLGLAQALLHDPPLLVLDEPLAGLDPASRVQVKTLLRQLSKQGKTILFSSHILSDVQDVATRVGILNRGKVLRVGTLEELRVHFGVAHDLDIGLSRDSGRWIELLSLPGVDGIEQPAPERLLAHLNAVADVDDTIHQLLVGLIDRDCWVRSITPVVPSLDDVYVSYVGDGNSE